VCCERARWSEALAHYRRALTMHVENGNQREETVTRYLIGGVLAELGEATEARAMLQLALQAAREIGARVYELEPLFRLAMVELDSGNPSEAERLLHEAQKTAREVGNRGAEAAVLAWLGMAHQLRGALGPASDAFREAIDLARASNVPWREAHALAHLAAVRALDPSLRREARSGFATARDIAERIGDPGLLATLDVLEELLDLDRARLRATEESSHESPSINARVARAILRRALEAKSASASASLATSRPSSPDEDTWRFAASGKWFSRGGAPRVELFTRRPLQRLVKRLIDRHLEKGEGLSVDDLLAAGWPNERVAGRSGASRVYNAVTTLKKLGLDPILLRRNDGYLLDPSAHVVLTDDRSRERGS
jgi:ATP/maltotriose-dependent transcriptional regulator MalT